MPDVQNGLPNDVSKEWGHPRLVTGFTRYFGCGGECCEGCKREYVPLPKKDWYWKPTLVHMDLFIPTLESDRRPIFASNDDLKKKAKLYRWNV